MKTYLLENDKKKIEKLKRALFQESYSKKEIPKSESRDGGNLSTQKQPKEGHPIIFTDKVYFDRTVQVPIQQLTFNSNSGGGHIMSSNQPFHALVHASSSSSSSSSGPSSDKYISLATPFQTMLDFVRWYEKLAPHSELYVIAQEFIKHLFSVFSKEPLSTWMSDIVVLSSINNGERYLWLLTNYIQFLERCSFIEAHHLQGLANILQEHSQELPFPFQVQLVNFISQQRIWTSIILSSSHEGASSALEVWSALLEGLWVHSIKLDANLKETLRKNLEKFKSIFETSSENRGLYMVSRVEQLLLLMENTGQHPAKQAIRQFGMSGWHITNVVGKCLVGSYGSAFSNVGDALKSFGGGVVTIGSWARDSYNTDERWFTYVYQQRAQLLERTAEVIDTRDSARLEYYIQNLYTVHLPKLSDREKETLIYELLGVIKQTISRLKDSAYKPIHELYFVLLTYFFSNTKEDAQLQVEIFSVFIYFVCITGELSGIWHALKFVEGPRNIILESRFNKSLQDALAILFGWLERQKREPEATDEDKEMIQKTQELIVNILTDKWNSLQTTSAQIVDRLKAVVIEDTHKTEIKEVLTCFLVFQKLAEEGSNTKERIDTMLAEMAARYAGATERGLEYSQIHQEANKAALLRLAVYSQQTKSMELTYVAWVLFPEQYKKQLFPYSAAPVPTNTKTPEEKYLFGKVRNAVIGVMRENEVILGAKTVDEERVQDSVLKNTFVQQEITRRGQQAKSKQHNVSSSSISLARETHSLFIQMYTKNGLTIMRDEVAIHACDEFMKLVKEELSKDEALAPSIMLIPSEIDITRNDTPMQPTAATPGVVTLMTQQKDSPVHIGLAKQKENAQIWYVLSEIEDGWILKVNAHLLKRSQLNLLQPIFQSFFDDNGACNQDNTKQRGDKIFTQIGSYSKEVLDELIDSCNVALAEKSISNTSSSPAKR